MINNKKNILCVSVMQNWGGGEEFLLSLCQNIKEYNFFIASPKGNSSAVFKENDIQTIEVDHLKKIYSNSHKWKTSSKLKMMFNIIFSTFALIKIIKAQKIDLILANGNFAGIYSLPSKFFTKKRFIVVQHLIYKEASIEGKIINILSKYSDKLVCVSQAVADNIRIFLKKNSNNKILVIHNGVKIPAETKDNHPNLIKIGMVGSIIRIKGIDLVLEALKDLLLQNEKIKFYIYGDVTSEPDSVHYKKKIIEIIEKNKIENKVSFCGHGKSKNNIYNNIDILINFSLVPESSSLTILEAMSYKKIVIANNEGGPKEIIENFFNGFLIKKGSKSQLNAIINYYIENVGKLEINEIRNNAYQHVFNNYNLRETTIKYSELFKEIL